jgi:hypothetical protein
MTLLTDDLRRRLLQNGELRRQLEQTSEAEADFYPVVKLHIPGTGLIWLLTELYPDDPDVAFGLCDLGMGFPELGDVRLSEFDGVRNLAGLSVRRDDSFSAAKTLSKYAERARRLSYVEA